MFKAKGIKKATFRPCVFLKVEDFSIENKHMNFNYLFLEVQQDSWNITITLNRCI